MVSSFDIFDTCLLRKCGTPDNFFDVLSLRVFNGEVEEMARQQFVLARINTQKKIQSNTTTLDDIWDAFSWRYPSLKPKGVLRDIEEETEREMLVPVLSMLKKVKECRKKGNRVLFVSDMYLSGTFLKEVLARYGFFEEGDGLYVSCECSMTKQSGELFGYIRERENLSYKQWRHYGDNRISDYTIPRQLGIKAELVSYQYSPYPNWWRRNDYRLGLKVGGIIAGICRALHYQFEDDDHKDFVLDIVAPLYTSFVYRIMKNASMRGIHRLYFCARDAYSVFRVAQKYSELFGGIEIRYLYISQKALYEGDNEAKLAYFLQEGLATKTDDVALVDIRSRGKTVSFLNELLENNGYRRLYGYYLEMVDSNNFTGRSLEYYSEWQDDFIRLNPLCDRVGKYWHLYEMFFSVHTQNRTLDYRIENNRATPVFDEGNKTDYEERLVENGYVNDAERWSGIHLKYILAFVDSYIETGLYAYSDEVFNQIAIPTFISFMDVPYKQYLYALQDFYVFSGSKEEYVPYVKRESIWRLLKTKGTDTYWKRGSLVLSLPEWVRNLYIRKR